MELEKEKHEIMNLIVIENDYNVYNAYNDFAIILLKNKLFR